MFKFIRFILFLILLAIVVIGAYFWVARVPTLERLLSKQLNTTVTIESIELGWKHFTIKGLKIYNPPGSKLTYAFQSDQINVGLSYHTLWQKTLHLERVKIVNPILGVELYNSSGTDNNWMRLINGFPTSSGKKYKIDQLYIINLQFEAIRSNGKSLSIPPIPYLEFENLGNKHPLTLSQISKVVFQSILSTLTSKPHMNKLLNKVSALPEQWLQGAGSTLPIEGLKEAIQGGADTFRRKTQEAGQYLKDLFSNQ